MPTFVQWVHVGAAVIGVGGIGFLAFILLPSTGILNADQRDLLMRVVQRRFRWVTWSVIGLLIVSGLYNAGLAWDVPWGTYWKFLTLKIVHHCSLPHPAAQIPGAIPHPAANVALRGVRCRHDRHSDLGLSEAPLNA